MNRRALAVTLALLATMGVTGMGKPGLSVACRVAAAKAAVPADLCERFAAAVQDAANRPVRIVTEGADLTLVVLKAGAYGLSARIDTDAGTGAARAMARRGAPLDPASYDAFLAALVAEAPLP